MLVGNSFAFTGSEILFGGYMGQMDVHVSTSIDEALGRLKTCIRCETIWARQITGICIYGGMKNISPELEAQSHVKRRHGDLSGSWVS